MSTYAGSSCSTASHPDGASSYVPNFLEDAQLVDALLRERHEQHVHSDTCNGIVFRFYISVFPTSRVLLCLALAFDELGRIR